MSTKSYAYLLIILSLIGLYASFTLTLDTIKLIENPGVQLPCNINPLLSCTSVASTWQSKVFGFPNPLLGIISFSMLFIVGLILLNGSQPTKNFWTLVNYGTLFSMLFVIWFFYQSVYDIGSLCIYCMAVWVVTWPLFLYTTVWNLKEDHIKLGTRISDLLRKHHLSILISGYLLATLLILLQFKDFFFG